MFDNRVLRGMFGPKRDEVTEDGRKLHNEDQIKKDEMGGVCSMDGEMRNSYKMLFRKL
jgi:hypothetical protein